MNQFNQEPLQSLTVGSKQIAVFDLKNENIDLVTVDSFGNEWEKFDSFNDEEIEHIGQEYFDIVPESILTKDTLALDLGCGSGRWSVYLSRRVGMVEAIDPSKAVYSAARLTASIDNIRISQASVDNIPFPDGHFDFAMSLGVLHHIPDTAKALGAFSRKIKSGGHGLIYLYYALDNRSALYRFIFHCSTLLRRLVSRLPSGLKKISCDLLAVVVYLPFVLFSRFIRLFSKSAASKIPLSYYADKSWNVIRNDSLDRFGTPLEQRFTKEQITRMMEDAGFTDLIFSPNMPCWHVLGRKL